MLTFNQFACLKLAQDYRRINGTGGWIFFDAELGVATLFPVGFTPSQIFNHILTHGKSGELF